MEGKEPGRTWETGIDTSTLLILCIKWITNENLLYSILSPCLFHLYAEYIMRHAGLEETQAGIKIAGRNINNLRYADDTTLMKVKKN